MLDRKVEAFLRRKQFEIENSSFLVGVSGGPDSLALVHFLWSRREKWNIKVVVAHLDHMFRGNESFQEAEFVKEFCQNRNIPVEVEQVNVPEYIEMTGLSSQVAARDCRYRFFSKVLNKYQLNYLALGHHGDDQIETVLMRLTRGSTGKARAGIPFSRPFESGEIVRPFLCVSKREIEDYCGQHQLEPRYDPSNEKDVYSRNRFRHLVLPFLSKENPQVHEHFQRFSEDIDSDESYLQELTVEKMNRVMKRKKDGSITIDIEGFRGMPMPLQRRGIQLILKYLYQENPTSLSAIHIDQLFSLMNNPQPSGTLDFPNGLKVVRSYTECHFQFSIKEAETYYYEINQPEVIILPSGDIITFEYGKERNEFSQKDTLLLPSDNVHLPIKIRTRKNGDRMTIKGMNGTKKIKDIFIDAKIPKYERDSWPIITDSFDNIIWVPGIKKSNLYPTEENDDRRYICISYKKH
ncbi:tRNA lysidine(34) synthetase TilS [Cytobacillus sp. FJAT-54145]|uniref:tRNA(Ile)-lysidine synthase n=1 Tax=Cytobacillus spartinae TaxID=3299023 RepID=A0ABW6KIH6_9BACI